MPSPRCRVSGNLTVNPLNAITANSLSDIWVVGDLVAPDVASEDSDGAFRRTYVDRRAESESEYGEFARQNVLTSVQANGPNDVTAVGITLNFNQQLKTTLIEHWDGTKWSVVPGPNASTAAGSLNTVTSISGKTGSNLYAVGQFANSSTIGDHRSLLVHFDGLHWTIDNTPLRGRCQHLNGVLALPNTSDVRTVGAFSY